MPSKKKQQTKILYQIYHKLSANRKYNKEKQKEILISKLTQILETQDLY